MITIDMVNLKLLQPKTTNIYANVKKTMFLSRKFANTRSTEALRDHFALPESPPTPTTLKLFHNAHISFCLGSLVLEFRFLFTLEIHYGDYLIGFEGPVRERTKLSIVLDPLHVRTFSSFRTTSISFIVIERNLEVSRIWIL